MSVIPKFAALIFILGAAYSSIIDVFGVTNGHEPRVALNCGKVPFYIDLQSGEWVSDSEGIARCDGDKEEVKSYCQKIYPALNITNIVEANKPMKFNTWCKPGSKQCDSIKKVVPYRCLVNEYEADALMVPDTCQFDHIHDQSLCMTHDQWHERAQETCKDKHKMKLKDFGILLSCKTDLFTGVEFVCCPKALIKQLKKQKKSKKIISLPTKQENVQENKDLFSAAIRNFQKYLPIETKGCDRTTYVVKQTEMEERHRNQIAAVVDEWDEAEKKYNELKLKDSVAAEEKMKRTLEVFRETLAALEDESKQDKNRLRAEHADCINTQINKSKRDSMLSYLSAIEEEPASSEKILKSVRKFIQVCEHDRVHSLRHFEHIRNRNPEKAETLRGDLLIHLKNLNKVVNESMSLLNYLPEIAQQFGVNGGGAILKPRSEMPQDDHDHHRVDEILKNANKVYGVKKATANPVDIAPTEDIPVEATPVSTQSSEIIQDETINQDDIDDDIEEREFDAYKINDAVQINEAKPLPKNAETTVSVVQSEGRFPSPKPDEEIPEVKEMVKILPPADSFDNNVLARIKEVIKHKAEAHDNVAASNKMSDPLIGLPNELQNLFRQSLPKSREHMEVKDDDEDDEEDRKPRISSGLRPKKSSYGNAVTAILGLSCGILVIILFVVVAMVIRRRRFNVRRLVVREDSDDREHLVQMQKSGFENPTYKFFYY